MRDADRRVEVAAGASIKVRPGSLERVLWGACVGEPGRPDVAHAVAGEVGQSEARDDASLPVAWQYTESRRPTSWPVIDSRPVGQ